MLGWLYNGQCNCCKSSTWYVFFYCNITLFYDVFWNIFDSVFEVSFISDINVRIDLSPESLYIFWVILLQVMHHIICINDVLWQRSIFWDWFITLLHLFKIASEINNAHHWRCHVLSTALLLHTRRPCRALAAFPCYWAGNWRARALAPAYLKASAKCIHQQKCLPLWFSSSMKHALSNETSFVRYLVQCIERIESRPYGMSANSPNHQKYLSVWFSWYMIHTHQHAIGFKKHIVQCIQCIEIRCLSPCGGHTHHQNHARRCFSLSLKVTLRQQTTYCL